MNPILDDEEFDYFRSAIYRLAGINLSTDKRTLVHSRLMHRLRSLEFSEFAEYKRYLVGIPPSHPEWQEFTNALTTNKTDFFREDAHFHYLIQTFLPQWLKTPSALPLSIWSAACSTGEEPYTLAILLTHALPPGRNFQVLATDIDTEALTVAKNGVYTSDKVERIPPHYFKRSFSRGTEGLTGWVCVKKEIKSHVSFATYNLLHSPKEQRFDIIFCRNVLIYFDPATVTKVIKGLESALKPGGLLFIGHSESLLNQHPTLEYVQPALYRKRG